MSKISPFFWFDSEAEEAADFYVGLFPNSKIKKVGPYPEAAEKVAGKPAGSAMTVDLELDGTKLTFLNGGKNEDFTSLPGPVSFVINCDSQEEIDKYWDAFIDGGKPHACGWIQDKYGITWQVIPTILPKLLSDPDQDKVNRVTACFMEMTKFDIAKLEAAARG